MQSRDWSLTHVGTGDLKRQCSGSIVRYCAGKQISKSLYVRYQIAENALEADVRPEPGGSLGEFSVFFHPNSTVKWLFPRLFEYDLISPPSFIRLWQSDLGRRVDCFEWTGARVGSSALCRLHYHLSARMFLQTISEQSHSFSPETTVVFQKRYRWSDESVTRQPASVCRSNHFFPA